VQFHNNSDSRKAKENFGGKAFEKTIRYTASKLYQKGVLISIEGLPESHLQNVLVIHENDILIASATKEIYVN